MIAVSGEGDERRKREADRRRAERTADREVFVPPCKNKRRRSRYERFDKDWLRFYFGVGSECPDPFWYPFTQQQLVMIEAIRSAIVYGGDQSIAASRGEGKTTLFERLLLKYTLQGVITFSVLCGATGAAAANSLESIRDAIETNERLLVDYPEVCVPVRALENTPNRAHYQIVTGERHDNGKPYVRHSSRFSWCGQEIIFPNVPGSPSSSSIIATRGLDAAVRGLKRKGQRPQLVGIDDPDTEDTSRSVEQAKKLEDRIDKALGGLGGQQRGVARVMLTTLQSRIGASYVFTDPTQKPTWQGKRFRFLLKKPTRGDLWEKYIQQRQSGMQKVDADGEPLDKFGRDAHTFYLANRKQMDKGARVANKNRFDPSKLPDGSQIEVSALQRYYNEVARIGQEAVDTEYDNDPPAVAKHLDSKLTWLRVAETAGDFAQRQVDPTTTAVVRGVDIRKTELHDVTLATDNAVRYRVADYGVRSHGTGETTVEQAEVLILEALRQLADEWNTLQLTDENGIAHGTDLVLVDKGWIGNWTEDGERKTWVTQPVETFCMEAGIDRFLPAKGAPHYDAQTPSHGKIIGDNWHINRGRGEKRMCDEVIWNADHWHRLVEELFLLSPDSKDRAELFAVEGGIWTNHKGFAGHIEAGSRQLHEKMARGTMSRKPRFVKDHWWDSMAMALVGMSIVAAKANRRKRPKRTLAQMAGR